jgi:hypothetical protein
MSWLKDKEQEELLAWYRDTTTTKIKEYIAYIRDQDLFGKIQAKIDAAVSNSDKARENAEKAWRVAQAIDDKASKTEGFVHGLANVLKFGASEAEKTYPSKKK